MESPATLSASAQFALILNGLMKAIAARFRDYPWTGELILFAWKRVNTINQKFQRLAELIQAGKLRPEKFSWPRAPLPPPDPGVGKSAPRFGVCWVLGTQKFGWLCRWMAPKPFLPGAGIASASLRTLLETSEMKALLAATPRMRKLLRPLCWMLCIEATLLPPAPRRIPRWRVSPSLEARDGAAPPPEADSAPRIVRLQMGPPGSMTHPFPAAAPRLRTRRRGSPSPAVFSRA